MAMRSGGTTVVCVLAIVLGALGWLTSSAGLVGLLAGDRAQQAIAAMQQADPEVGRVQAEMNAKLMEVAERYWWTSATVVGVNAILSTVLVVGGALGLGLMPSARRLLLGACVAGLIFELARVGPNWVVLRETQKVSNEYMPQVMDAALPPNAKAPPGSRQMMQTVFSAINKLQFAVILAQALIQSFFYAIGWRHLRSAKTRAEFAPASNGGTSAVV